MAYFFNGGFQFKTTELDFQHKTYFEPLGKESIYRGGGGGGGGASSRNTPIDPITLEPAIHIFWGLETPFIFHVSKFLLKLHDI